MLVAGHDGLATDQGEHGLGVPSESGVGSLVSRHCERGPLGQLPNAPALSASFHALTGRSPESLRSLEGLGTCERTL